MNTRTRLVEGAKQFLGRSRIEPKLLPNDPFKSTFLIGDFKPSLLKMKLKNDVTTLVPLVNKVYCTRNSNYSQNNAPGFTVACRRAGSILPPSNKIYNDAMTTRPEHVSPYLDGSFITGHGKKKWQKGKVIGIGSYGSVHEGYNEDGLFFAAKEVSLHDQGPHGDQRINQLQQEISIMSKLSHPNIVQYLGTHRDDDNLYIFLELATKGSLAELIENYYLRDSEVSAYTRQILSGLRYLHEQNVIHGDVKCANILVDVNGSVKLADFGTARATIKDSNSCQGTPYWMAPEVANSSTNEGYGSPADIWSLGCTVLEMLTRKIPYSHLGLVQAALKISRGELPEIPNTLSEEARRFILKCLNIHPNNRPSAAQLLNDPFLKIPTSTNSTLASPHRNATHY